MSQRSDAPILIVRHGDGLGRLPRFGERALAWIARHDPELAGEISVHETGAAAVPAAAAKARAVVFWLADPLKERYPDCYEEAQAIGEVAARRGALLVNPPATLSNTVRSTQTRLWQEAGLPCPAGARYRSRAELEALLASAELPVLVCADRFDLRPAIRVCRTPDEVLAAEHAGGYPGMVTPFIDPRHSWGERDPASVWARFYHRKRAFVLGDVVVPSHVTFSEAPIVSWNASIFRRYRGWGSVLQPLALVRRWDRLALAADNAFWRGAPEHPALIRRAAAALGFGFAAVDYATFADGSVILWDATPHPYIPEWHHAGMPVVRHTRARVHGLYAAIAGYLRNLLHEHAERRRFA
ncbi:MAG TPA: hypothetical protein VFU46_01890 [Gemmatimonadales bacterium]|nr:hypothetical protein [Gemmatimonadales bacterium]